MDLSEKIFNAGVVGAGGGGFPTHIKANSSVKFVIANGAECEPLLHKDFEIMVNRPKEIVEGMQLMMEQTNSIKGYFGIKGKNAKAVNAVAEQLDEKIEMSILGDYYPSGDEYELVYETTKRLIPPHGIPLDVECLVNNVETFYNIKRASEDIPVTEKFLCVTGAVNKPFSAFVPVGTSFKELIDFAGGSTIKDYGIFISGLLMGSLTFDMNEVVTKTTGGLIILPKKHYLVQRMDRSVHEMNKIGKSACDQCSYCTEFCPRYLLGYDVQPHKVMRSLGFTKTGEAVWNQYADLCCSCGLCSLYSCPEDLYPREACDQGKAELKSRGEIYKMTKDVKVHPIKDGRRVPLKQLMKKLNVIHYNQDTPFVENFPKPNSVKIKLKQHAGSPADAIVSMGDIVSAGDMIGKINSDLLGANIHASINGSISEINDEFIKISK